MVKKLFCLLFFFLLVGCSLFTYELPEIKKGLNISEKKSVNIRINVRKNYLSPEAFPKTELFIFEKDKPDYTVHVFSVPTGKTDGIMYDIWSVAFLLSLTTIPIHMEGQLAFKIQDNKTGQFVEKKTDIIVNELYGILIPVPWISSPYTRTASILDHVAPVLYQEIANQIYDSKSALHTSKDKYVFPLKETLK